MIRVSAINPNYRNGFMSVDFTSEQWTESLKASLLNGLYPVKSDLDTYDSEGRPMIGRDSYELYLFDIATIDAIALYLATN